VSNITIPVHTRNPRGCKIINFAKLMGGNLVEFYTELNHNFLVGDRLFIIGGAYDNVEKLSYSSLSSLYNTGYIVTSVNYAFNSFVVDLGPAFNQIYTTGTTDGVIHPYGVLNNRNGNPLITTAGDRAYNTYYNNDLYKSVFVCNTVFLNGRFRKGKINNGIFGTDTKKVEIGRDDNYTGLQHKADVKISHIIGKNIHVTTGTIESKTYNTNVSTIRFAARENTTNWGVSSLGTNVDNNGYGYSYFERFTNKPIAAGNLGLTVSNTHVNNLRPGFINLDYVEFVGCRIGESGPCNGTNSLVISNSKANNSRIMGCTITNNYNMSGGYMDLSTYISPQTWQYGTASEHGVIVLNVPQNMVAGRQWSNCSGIASGIMYQGFVSVLNNISITIIEVNYTFGSPDSMATVKIRFNDYTDSTVWNNFKNSHNINSFNFGNLRLFINNTITKAVVIGSANIFAARMETNTNEIYISGENPDNKTNFSFGLAKGIMFNEHVDLGGESWTAFLQLENSRQLFVPASGRPFFTYVLLKNNDTMQGEMTDCIIDGGSVQNSILHNTNVIGNTFILDSVVSGTSKVQSPAKWEFVRFIPAPDTIHETYIEEGGSLLGRKTPFITDRAGLNGNTNVKHTELNKRHSTNTTHLGQSLSVAAFTNNIPNYTYRFRPVRTSNISTNTGVMHALVDRGDVVSDVSSNNRNVIVYSGILNNNTTMLNAINNINNDVASGTVHTSFPTVDGFSAIDNNYVVTNTYSRMQEKGRVINDFQIYIYDQPPIPAGFPNPTGGFTSFLKIREILSYDSFTGLPTYGYTNDNIAANTGTTTWLNATQTDFPGANAYGEMKEFELSFRFNKPTGTNVPACFVEVERIVFTALEGNPSFAPYAVFIKDCNFCPNTPGYTAGSDSYQFDLTVPMSAYPNDFVIKHKGGDMIVGLFPVEDRTDNHGGQPKFEDGSGVGTPNGALLEISVEYWVTWYYGGYSGIYSGGHRQKYVANYTVGAEYVAGSGG
jgi:hypothetical protein